MLFNSIEFFVFLPLVLGLYHVLATRAQNRLLLLASYLFYGWWDVRFLFLIAASTVVDYCSGLMIDRGEMTASQRARAGGFAISTALFFLVPSWDGVTGASGFPWVVVDWGEFTSIRPTGVWVVVATILAVVVGQVSHSRVRRLKEKTRRSLFLTASIVTNLSILGFFKYFDFFVESGEELVRAFGVDASWMRLDIVLPVGISFYTFQTMSYTIDVYRRQLKATDRFLDFSLYVAFFPQLVAGPIERARHLLPLLLASRSTTMPMIWRGAFLILLGMFKKVGIADSIAPAVDSVYGSTGVATFADVTLATVLFAIQIYCDFSGYSDIARGTSKLMGIDLMNNFDLPYVSTNPQEFWRRWHISLSSWLRDYLYIPLGGSRGSTLRVYRNLMLTMVLGGLWHGAAWNFVLWGTYQGGVLCIHRRFWPSPKKEDPRRGTPARLIRKLILIACFFTITCYGWLLFRAASFEQILDFTAALFTDFGNFSTSIPRPTFAGLIGIPVLVLFECAQYLSGDPRFYLRLPRFGRGALYAVMLVVILMGLSNAPVQFIYFQF